MQDEKGKTEFDSVHEAKVRKLGPGLITENLDAEFDKAKTVNLPLVPPGTNPEVAIRQAMRKRAPYGYSVTKAPMKKTASTFETSHVYDVPYNPFRQRLTIETPRNITELNARYRFYTKYEPLVGAAIELHTQFPLSTFNVDHEDKEVSAFFNDMMERLDMLNFLTQMVSEYWVCGEAFPFGFLDDPYDPTEWERFVLLNPDNVVLESHPMIMGDRNYNIFLTPDAAISKIVENGPGDEKTGSLYKQIPVDIIDAVKTKKPMQLNDLQVSHFKRSGDPFNLRGESLLSRILHLMAYRDKLREAQYVLCDRHVTPREFYFIGDKDQPADEEELQNFADLLATAFMDPNQAIVWHHAVNPQVVGTADKVLPLRQEFTQIEEEMLTALMISKAFTHSEGPCWSPDTEVLTENGFKSYDAVEDKEKLATFNIKTNTLEYENFSERIVKDFSGELVHFKTNYIDGLCTPNHWMLVQKPGEITWSIQPAEKVERTSTFRACVENYDGEYPYPTVDVLGTAVDIKDFVAFLGYYISEGSTSIQPKFRTYQVRLSQKDSSKYWADIENVVKKMPIAFKYYGHDFVSCNKKFAEYMQKLVPGKAADKFIPKQFKNLPKPLLEVLLNALVNGDGNRRSKGFRGDGTYASYITTSARLADDVYEVVLKLGYTPYKTLRKSGTYCVSWSTSKFGKFPKLESGSSTPNYKKEITRVPYKGKVWCFTVPNGFIITRRNGRVGIHHNTYANASVALDVLISKYITLRNHIEKWLNQNVFTPMCVIHNLYKPTEAELSHRIRTRRNKKPLWLPKIKWVKSDLRNNENKIKLLQALMEKGLYPKQKFFKAIDEDYDEVKRLVRAEKLEEQAEKQADTLAGQPKLPPKPGAGPALDIEAPPDFGGGGEAPEAPEPPEVPNMEGTPLNEIPGGPNTPTPPGPPEPPTAPTHGGE